MRSGRAEIAEAFTAWEAAQARLADLDYGGLTPGELLELQTRREVVARRDPVIDHALLAALTAQTGPKAVGAKNWAEVLRIRLRISAQQARRRLRDAENLGPRTALSGQPLAPRRAATAAAQAAGRINQEHVDLLDTFAEHLPDWVDATTAQQAEQTLLAVAAHQPPEALQKAADQTLYLLNQDGPEPVDEDCQRKRAIRVEKQAADGMTRMLGLMTPELRAALEPLLAKLTAPGMCNPAEQNPCISGTPSQAQIDADTRTYPQRVHDAMLVICRIALMSGQLGQHNGLPVSIVVTTTLQELEAGAGVAVTAGGARLPIPDLIRLASHAWHYLAVFDKHTNVALHLGRTKRIATPGQRLMLFARDRGCTRPGCTASGYACQAHHAQQDWDAGGRTDIDDLALACGPDNRLVTAGGWSTAMNTHGRCEWTPPRLLDTRQARVNNYHHPQLYLTELEDDDETDCQPA
ncbi:DUF222 domain-containing protein [Mycobacterium sp. NPDC003449]